MFIQLCHAIKFLHDKDFSHLDIKLENTLLDKYFNVKLGDFGSGVSLVKTHGYTTQKVGTPLYMAPEVKELASGDVYEGLKADIYSLGVTLCLMLLGELPDSSVLQNERSTVGSFEYNEMESSDETFSDKNQCSSYNKLDFLSNSSKDLLAQMMSEDPSKRPNIDEVMSHEWITSTGIEGLQEDVYFEMKARMEAITAPLNQDF